MSTPSERPPFRRVLRQIMEPYEPGVLHPVLSLVVDLTVLFCIIASCAVILLEYRYPRYDRLFWHLEVAFTLIFVVEYLLRWYSSRDRLRYPFTFFAVIDLLAIVPTLTMVGAEALTLRVFRGIRLLRLLRLLRLVRLLKFIRYGYLIFRGFIRVRTWFAALNHQYRLKQLARLFVWAVISWIVGANVVYFTESRLSGSGPFVDYWHSYWNIMIVLVSGIEDKEPLSLLGRIEVTVMLIVGICIVGLLTGEIVAILVKKAGRVGRIAIKPPSSKMEQHFLVLGRNSHLDNVIRQIHAATKGRHYILVVCPDAEEIRATDREVYSKVFVLAGDPVRADVLDEAHVDKALRVIVLADEDGDEAPHMLDSSKLMQMLAVVGRRHPVPMVVELHDPQSELDAMALGDEGVEFMLVKHYGEGLITQAVLNPGVTKIYDQLMTFSSDTNEFYTIPLPKRFEGWHFRDVQLAFLDDESSDIVLVGIDRSPPERPNTRFVLNPCAEECNCAEEELVLKKGDQLVVLAFDRPSIAEIDTEDLWSGKVLKGT